MYSLFNPTDRAQDFIATIYYSDGSGSYEMPVHLEAQASTMIDMMMLIGERVPDVHGKVIPPSVQQGSLVFESAKGKAQWMTLVVSSGVYNPRRGTCGVNCIYCYGYCNTVIILNPFAVAVQATTNLYAQATYSDGTVQDFTTSSSWTSDNTPVATVGSSTGVVTGGSVGSANIIAAFPTLVAAAGQVCAAYEPFCPTFTATPSSGGNVISIQYVTASLVYDQIQVSLQGPSGVSGQLLVTWSGPSGNSPIDNTTRGIGIYTFNPPVGGLAAGQYTAVLAQWTVGTAVATGGQTLNFKVLGNYRHSVYNTPTESTCGGGTGSATQSLGPPNCAFTAFNPPLLSLFISQAWLNGSGNSINFGLFQNEAICPYPPGVTTNVFRSVSSIVLSCGTFVDNTTVARNLGNPDLTCEDQVLIVGLGSSPGTVKTVTDGCPLCTSTQLDNYTTQAACNPHSFADLGNFLTIRLNH